MSFSVNHCSVCRGNKTSNQVSVCSHETQHISKIIPFLVWKQDEEATTVQVKEQDQDVLVLKKVSSEKPASTAGSGETDWR